MLNLRLLLTLLLALFLSSKDSWADSPVFYSFTSESGHYNFEGGFNIKADPSVVWDVLTDYNHYNHYINNLKAKVVRDKPGEDLVVEQDAGGGFLFIQEHIKARLDVHEVAEQSISFQDIDHTHFTLYAGVWTLRFDPEQDEVSVGYALEATRSPQTPRFLTSDLFGSSLGDLLSEMEKEMVRRESKREQQLKLAVKTDPTPVSSPTSIVEVPDTSGGQIER